MTSENDLQTFATLAIPAFKDIPAVNLNLSATREGEMRLMEARFVNPSTFTDLSYCFNEAYRELKRHVATVGYQIDKADEALEKAKSAVLIDKYPDFIKDKPKSHDSADLRKAYLMRDEDYLAALDRTHMLKAMQALLEGKIKVMENVCRYMSKQMDLIKGGIDPKLYVTLGKK